MLRNQQNKLKTTRTSKVRAHDSIETKMFSILKEFCIELSSYHGGSLNGKDIKKVMNNACHIFNTFLAIFIGGEEANLRAVGRQHQRFMTAVWRGVCFMGRSIFISEDNQSSGSRNENLPIVC